MALDAPAGLEEAMQDGPAPQDGHKDVPAMDLAALIRDSVRQAIAPLEERLAEVEGRAPVFRPMDPNLGKEMSGPERRAILRQPLKAGQERQAEEMLPVGSDSHRLPEHVLARVPRTLRAGQAIRLRRDVTRAGMAHDRTWGDILDGIGTIRCARTIGNRRCRGTMPAGEPCPVCGEGPVVVKVSFFNEEAGDWMVKARIPGLTEGYGMHFFSQELEAA